MCEFTGLSGLVEPIAGEGGGYLAGVQQPRDDSRKVQLEGGPPAASRKRARKLEKKQREEETRGAGLEVHAEGGTRRERVSSSVASLMAGEQQQPMELLSLPDHILDKIVAEVVDKAVAEVEDSTARYQEGWMTTPQTPLRTCIALMLRCVCKAFKSSVDRSISTLPLDLARDEPGSPGLPIPELEGRLHQLSSLWPNLCQLQLCWPLHPLQEEDFCSILRSLASGCPRFARMEVFFDRLPELGPSLQLLRGLRHLKCLKLECYFPHHPYIPHYQMREATFPSLPGLEVLEIPHLDMYLTLEPQPALKQLILGGGIGLYFMVVRLASLAQSTQLQRLTLRRLWVETLELPNSLESLDLLDLWALPSANLTPLREHQALPHLRALHLENFLDLQDFEFPEPGEPNFDLDHVFPHPVLPSRLTSLDLGLSISHLPEVWQPDSLRSLTIARLTSASTINIAQFPSLTNLCIGEGNTSLEWVSGLEASTNLRALTLRLNDTKVEEFPHLESCQLLADLLIDRLPVEPTMFAAFEALRNLTLFNIKGSVELDGYSFPRSLKSLSIHSCDLSTVPGAALEHLEKLRLTSLPHLKSLQSLTHLTSLKFLEVHDLPDLVSWFGSNPGGPFLGSALGLPSFLKECSISRCPRLSEPPSFANCQQMEDLFLDDLSCVQHLQGLCHSLSMRRLTITRLPLLKELELVGLERLMYLQVQNCEAFQNLRTSSLPAGCFVSLLYNRALESAMGLEKCHVRPRIAAGGL